MVLTEVMNLRTETVSNWSLFSRALRGNQLVQFSSNKVDRLVHDGERMSGVVVVNCLSSWYVLLTFSVPKSDQRDIFS